MVVRFLPSSPSSGPARGRPGDLAEVIDLRSRLAGGAGATAQGGAATSGPAPDERAEVPAATALADVPEAASVDAATQRTAHEDAIRVLARRARSSGELRRELLAAGHPQLDVEEAVETCVESLYLDDQGLARLTVQTLRERKGASRSQIRMKLRERLLPDHTIEVALGELDADEEYELLRAAAADRARKLTGLDRQTAERRLLGFLARRGWSGEPAVRAAREALDASGGPSPVRFR